MKKKTSAIEITSNKFQDFPLTFIQPIVYVSKLVIRLHNSIRRSLLLITKNISQKEVSGSHPQIPTVHSTIPNLPFHPRPPCSQTLPPFPTPPKTSTKVQNYISPLRLHNNCCFLIYLNLFLQI